MLTQKKTRPSFSEVQLRYLLSISESHMRPHPSEKKGDIWKREGKIELVERLVREHYEDHSKHITTEPYYVRHPRNT